MARKSVRTANIPEKSKKNHTLEERNSTSGKEIHLIDTYIAGTTIYGANRRWLDELKLGANLILQRDLNSLDKNSIRIRDSRRRTLGYVPEKDNLILARLMDAGKKTLW